MKRRSFALQRRRSSERNNTRILTGTLRFPARIFTQSSPIHQGHACIGCGALSEWGKLMLSIFAMRKIIRIMHSRSEALPDRDIYSLRLLEIPTPVSISSFNLVDNFTRFHSGHSENFCPHKRFILPKADTMLNLLCACLYWVLSYTSFYLLLGYFNKSGRVAKLQVGPNTFSANS